MALISGGLAHFAGSQIHYNNLIGKAHAWWRATPKDDRTPKLKQLYSINLDATFDDDDKPDYQHIMARVHANAEVSQKKNWVVGFFALILIFAVAAFWIRAETLKSIETEMISSLQPPAAAGTMAGPFDLPEISEDINNAEVEVSIQEQIDAIRSASLMTYVVLSVIYIAIQCIMLWLAIAYGFKGIHSKAAWKYTHKFQSADELEDWLETKRNKIRGHANEKLRALQQKRSMLHTTDSDRDDASSSVDVAARHFLAFVSMENMPRAAADADRNKGVNASGAAAESGKLAPGSSPSTTSRDAMNFHDITEMSDTELSALSRAMKLDLSELQDIQEQQKALKLIGHFGVKTAANEVIEDQEDKVDPIDAATFNDLTELEVSELAMASKSLNIDVEILQDIREQQLVMKKLGMFASKETA
ncbi:hypothetical protein GCM10011502_02460 [Oceanisphaera marina]|uniref:Uncharacterized protein n=1 Tax=Oceanisphaera marina TaxID=2017550 RepID=A0ABQ1ICC6_9GAMM|nr:hypothetical protein [Oceanisphaera marina]GGB32891.1 hypothetical protein GCM10011502_02460 [Oceanisphaera marina]